jgi:hypothetical protein
LLTLEWHALWTLRRYDRGEVDLEETLDAVMAYGTPDMFAKAGAEAMSQRAVAELRGRYSRTLSDRPWKICGCAVCRAASIEVLLFRGSNRNKRRGIHNLGVFRTLVDDLPDLEPSKNEQADLFGNLGSSESFKQSAVLCS